MSWLRFNNGLFTASDFDIRRYGGSGNDELGYKRSENTGLNIVDPRSFGRGRSAFYEGNEGNDTIIGYASDDVLVGVNADETNAGNGEYDRLNGGGGYDTFVLGDVYEAYYLGNGYATIEDFQQGIDMLAGHGSSSDYTFDTSQNVIGGANNDTILAYRGDTIAVFEDTVVNLNVDDFYFL